MNIKQKLHTGFGLLFLVVLFFGGLTLFYIRVIANSNKVILKDNYATLGYVDEMRTILEENDSRLTPEAVNEFRAVLSKERANITEEGEKEAVEALNTSFNSLVNPATPEARRLEARNQTFAHLSTISTLNLDAVDRKSKAAEKAIQNATLYLSVAALITFVVLFSFVFNMAGFFEEPLKRLTEGMQEIGRNKNFHTRLDFDRNDEFGEISVGFNKMAAQLSQWNQDLTTTIAHDKKCIEILVQHIVDPVVGIDGSEKIMFLNPAARKLFGLPEQPGPQDRLSDSAITDMLQNYHTGTVRVEDINYLVEIHNIVPPPSEFPELEGAETMTSAGKVSGKIYVFKKGATVE